MKTKLSIIFCSFLLVAGASESQACSMMPFDPAKALKSFQAEMVASALVGLHLSQDDVLKTTVSNEEGNYIWNNPMCPEGSWVSAEFEFSVRSPDRLTKGCTAVAEVTRTKSNAVVNKGVIIHPAVNSILVNIVSALSCLE